MVALPEEEGKDAGLPPDGAEGRVHLDGLPFRVLGGMPHETVVGAALEPGRVDGARFRFFLRPRLVFRLLPEVEVDDAGESFCRSQ